MSSSASRFELLVDVFDLRQQRAMPLQALSVRQMVDSILKEFGEIEFLGKHSGDYALQKVGSGDLLDDDGPLLGQVAAGDHVRLIEREMPQPSGTWRPTHNLYLRDRDERGELYRIGWLPALVGRPMLDESDAWLAVNLQDAPTGMRVSRRQVRLFEDGGRYFIEAMSSNPVTLLRTGEPPRPLGQEEPLEVRGDDMILLDRSNIHLRFLVRDRDANRE